MRFFCYEFAFDLGKANTVFYKVQIENRIMKVLEGVKSESYDLMRNGIWLARGGALLRGIAKRFSDRMNMTFHIADAPLKAVARGTCKAIEDTEKYKYKFLMR